MRRTVGSLVIGGAALSLAGLGAGTAAAETAPAPSPLESGSATTGAVLESFALATDDRPVGADGIESEFPDADYRFVEGPASGLLDNGPLE